MTSGENKYLVVCENLEKTITAESHLASVLDATTLGPEHLNGENLTPMIRITYEELDLSRIEAEYRVNEKDLFALRNFLVGKKKGLDKNKCVFGLYCLTKFPGAGDGAVYLLQEEKELYDKVYDCPEVSAKLKICGLAQEPVFLEVGTRACHGHKDRTFELVCEGTNSNFKVRKEQLKNPEGQKNISFYFTVSIGQDPVYSDQGSFSSTNNKSILQSIYDLPDSSKDVTIVTANNEEIKAHRNILMAQSPVFCSMLNSDNAMAEAQSGKILMEGNSKDGITQFVRYLYGFYINKALSSDLALEVFQLSHKYGVKELEGHLKKLLVNKRMDWYSVDSLLELYFYVENNKDFEELRAYALMELSELSNQALTESDFYKRMDKDEQINLLLTLWSWSRIRI